MRLSAERIYQKQGWDDIPDQFSEQSWLRVGFDVADWAMTGKPD